jgi:hypothetical protein
MEKIKPVELTQPLKYECRLHKIYNHLQNDYYYKIDLLMNSKTVIIFNVEEAEGILMNLEKILLIINKEKNSK